MHTKTIISVCIIIDNCYYRQSTFIYFSNRIPRILFVDVNNTKCRSLTTQQKTDFIRVESQGLLSRFRNPKAVFHASVCESTFMRHINREPSSVENK